MGDIADPIRPIPCDCGGFWPDDHVDGCTSAAMAKLWPKAYQQELRPTSEAPKCEEHSDLFVSVGGNRVPCDREATWEVTVNPPTAQSDGKVRLCDVHNRVDYIGFARSPVQLT
jgi:hypothetical protein